MEVTRLSWKSLVVNPAIPILLAAFLHRKRIEMAVTSADERVGGAAMSALAARFVSSAIFWDLDAFERPALSCTGIRRMNENHEYKAPSINIFFSRDEKIFN